MAQDKNKTGIMEIVAVAALIFLLWRIFMKKRSVFVRQPEPPTTAKEMKDQFGSDLNFNLKDYCQNVVYRPLSMLDLEPAELLGKGYCYRGDGSSFDPANGFGDAYADDQAQKYIAMKQAEAIFINNKLCVQFRLINSTAVKITTELLNTTQDVNVVDGTYDGGGPLPPAPVSAAGSAITESGFTANWNISLRATGYYLDVATDSGFLSLVAGYNNKDVGDVLNEDVTGLTDGTTYYYRVRAYNDSGTSGNSDIISLKTLIVDADGNVYTSTIIGSLEWMGENLKATKYNDGTSIPNLTTVADWDAEDGTPGHDGAYCWFDNDIVNKALYGAMYNWYVVNNAHGLAPAGWRIATRADYLALGTFLGGASIAGGKLKSMRAQPDAHPRWDTAGYASDIVGFHGLPEGRRDYNSPGAAFRGRGEYCNLWSTTEYSSTHAYYYALDDLYVNIDEFYIGKGYGHGVRCVRDV
jgi:uncharacterized protein (TIGR02145 family)